MNLCAWIKNVLLRCRKCRNGTTDENAHYQHFVFGDKVEVKNRYDNEWEKGIYISKDDCFEMHKVVNEHGGILNWSECRHADW